jgi:hypothetical protein
VAPADVPGLAVVVVGAAEEQRAGGVVGQRLRPLPEGDREELLGDLVPAGDLRAQHPLPHPGQLGPGVHQVPLLGPEGVTRGVVGGFEDGYAGGI